MLRTIYSRQPNDPNYNPDTITHSSELESILMKIRMIFHTTKGEVLGLPDFGLDIEDLLFTFNLNEFTLKETIYTHLHTYISDLSKYNLEISVKFFKGNRRDVALIDIRLNDVRYLGFEYN